jgi:hypothetical protein
MRPGEAAGRAACPPLRILYIERPLAYNTKQIGR